jgi:pimeloyl-ACP methyl ester carboxylesterase
MRKELSKDKSLHVRHFGYMSTCYDESILDRLNYLIESIPEENEIVFVAHSMGGLVSRLYLNKFKPQRKIKLITLGTPHNGSLIADKINKTFLRVLLGKSTKAGLVDPIPAWDNKYPLISIAGIKNKGIVNIFAPHSTEDNDGTVFLSETMLANATANVVLQNMHHSQMIINSRAIEEVKKWI